MLACPCRAKNANADPVPRVVLPSATMEEAFQADVQTPSFETTTLALSSLLHSISPFHFADLDLEFGIKQLAAQALRFLVLRMFSPGIVRLFRLKLDD